MTRELSVPGGTIAYDLTGPADGPLVVCLPGMGDRRGAYAGVAARLAEAGYRVASVDLRGHGESSVGWDDHGQAALGADAAALVRELGGPAVVVGHSYTPDSALVAAAAEPERVRGVVAIAPWAGAPALNPLMRMATAVVARVPALWGAFMRSLYVTKSPEVKRHVATVVAGLRRPGGTAGLRAMADPDTKDAIPARAEATIPALVLMGEGDPDFPDPRAEAERYAADLGGSARVELIARAGHYPHVERPQETADAVAGFLAELGMAGAVRA